MFPFQSYYGMESNSNQDGFLQGLSSMETMNNGGSTFKGGETKAIAACKSHSEAERRRRGRINGHLATLRTLLPNTAKTDKASLLAEVVQQVKELKRLAANVVGQDGPGETDELTMSYADEESSTSTLIRASLCCDDRPDLLTDLTLAIRSVGVKVVKAEMATVGGRTKSVVVMEGQGSGSDDFGTLKRALKGVVDKPTVSESSSLVMLPGNKRPRRLSRQLLTNDF